MDVWMYFVIFGVAIAVLLFFEEGTLTLNYGRDTSTANSVIWPVSDFLKLVMKRLDKYKNIFSKYKEILMPASVLVLLILGYQVYLFFGLEGEEETRLNYSTIVTNIISIIGSIASVVGLIIAYQQIKELKRKATESEETTRATNLEIKKALKSVKEMSIVLVISKSISLLREIQGYLIGKEIKIALMKMKDLKVGLIGISKDKDLQELKSQRRLKRLTIAFEVDIKNINILLSDPTENIEVEIISDNLERISTELIDIQKQLENNKYEQ